MGVDAMLVLDSLALPAASPYDETQLPCSPSDLHKTDVAAATLKALDTHETRVEDQAQ